MSHPLIAGVLGDLGRTTLFAWQATRATFQFRHGPDYLQRILAQCAEIGADSAPLVAVVSAFAGAMLVVQGYATLAKLGAPELLGLFIALGGVREVFPLIAAGTIGAKAGSAIAAELGTLRIGEQLDALEVMAVDPIEHLVAPRLLAALLMTPLVLVVSTVVGLGAAFLTAAVQLGVDPGSYLARLYGALTPGDLGAVMVKGVVFGAIIAVVTAAEGFATSGGPAGVGRAANRAVVRAVIAGSLVNLALSQLFFGGP